MSLEQKLRDNLKTAADALIVTQPKQAPLPKQAAPWWRGPGFALAGAAAVLALALPALLLWSGGGSSSEQATSGTDPSTVVEPTDVAQTSTPTTTMPATTSTIVQGPDTTGTTATLGELTFNDHTLVLVATLVDETEQPTATVVLQATSSGGTEPSEEIVVGSPGGFFWHSVSGEGGVCEFSVDETDEGTQVTVQILLSPSMGCSDRYLFIFEGGRNLTPDIEAPEDVAQQFVASWEAGDEETMTDLADPGALRQAHEMSTPEEPSYSYCEGAAGSVYCTFEIVGGELVVRVRTEPPARVIEVLSFSDD
jgi:hypothetical protein